MTQLAMSGVRRRYMKSLHRDNISIRHLSKKNLSEPTAFP
jgi:hypothetical protein